MMVAWRFGDLLLDGELSLGGCRLHCPGRGGDRRRRLLIVVFLVSLHIRLACFLSVLVQEARERQFFLAFFFLVSNLGLRLSLLAARAPDFDRGRRGRRRVRLQK